MRKLFVYMVMIALCGCEMIDRDNRYIPVETADGGRRHVLLDFTGFRCVNCPEASEQAEQLVRYDAYGLPQLVIIALHPASNPFTQGRYDYTCPAADSVYRWMGGTASTPFPTGNIDFKPHNGTYFTDRSEWAALLFQAADEEAVPYLSFTADADTVNRIVTVSIRCERTEARMACWLVEDSVPGVQAMPDGSVNTEYIHRHMLRAAASDNPFGVPVNASDMTARITVPDGCLPEQCSVVAMLLDKNDYHLLNAYEKKVSLVGDRTADSD